MDPMIFVALVLFAAVVALWVALPGSIESESRSSSTESAPLLSRQQQV